MTFLTNDNFKKLLEYLSDESKHKPSPTEQPEYKKFIEQFPAINLASLTLDQYCIGKGGNESFCWLIERGLETVLGRYSPGRSRGHILYFQKDGTVYKIQKLQDLPDSDALAYTLKIQSLIANADVSQDLTWIDDDAELYRRAELTPRVTIGDGRKLRLLNCYHPDDCLPISSSDHLKHFLEQFGFSAGDIPPSAKPVARMLMLRTVFDKAKESIPSLNMQTFMHALYTPELGLAPIREPNERVDVPTQADQPNSIVLSADGRPPLNTILFGPPGTGKTHATIDAALAILDPDFLAEHPVQSDLDWAAQQERRKALKQRFDELKANNQIGFVTFHQSFSYEDFVEGLRAETNAENVIEYKVEGGVFKQLCDAARTFATRQQLPLIATNPRIWKISIDSTGPSSTRQYCLDHGEARIGWGSTGNLKNGEERNDYFKSLGGPTQNTLQAFAEEISIGDILLCIKSVSEIGAVGVVSGTYRYEEHPPSPVYDYYTHVLPVNWIYRDLNLSILPLNDNKGFTLKTVYKLERFSWGDLLAQLDQSTKKPEALVKSTSVDEPHVLIIDEINRGNISRIFGELITLIEPSKRAGADEALEVTLPYSKKPFSIPSNVYLIGTMNTADRSLAGLDIALRRRFVFQEMPPRPELLDDITIDGVNIGTLLHTLNERIEVLLDRDHCLGHAYFISLKDHKTLDQLAFIFRQQIFPLLQEYFFEDWERISWVLNNQPFLRKSKADLSGLFGADVASNLQNIDRRWCIDEEAFYNIENYHGVLGASA